MPGEGDRAKLRRLKIEGFRSIAFSDLDVLIGANGAGKSNLIAFLRMVSLMLSSENGSPCSSAARAAPRRCCTTGPR